jgi:polysaccharide export outer membrane protein
MRPAKFLLPLAAALALAACARQQPAYYVMDPQTGQQVPVVQQYSGPQQYVQAQATQQQYTPPQYQAPAQSSAARGFFNSAQSSYAQPQYAPAAQGQGRGLFGGGAAQPQYTPPQQSYVLQYQPQQPYAGAYQAAPYAYGSAQPNYQPAYTLDAGDKLRISVFGQEGISGSYMVDAGGNVNLPLAGAVPARGFSTDQLAKMIGERLKQGYVREPHVTVSVETYRPFFIMGEVTTPGQYAYVPNMTAENAIAIAGGFGPRAQRQTIELTRNASGQRFTQQVPLNYPMQPGDTVVVKERWF